MRLEETSVPRLRFRAAGWVAAAILAAGPSAAAPPEAARGPRIETHPGPADSILGARRLHVWLPAEYDGVRRLPVVYAVQGQDLFDPATATGGEEWALDELLAAHPPGVAPLLVVGVESAPTALRDFSPPGSMSGARGDLYVRYLCERVKPFVDSTYATRREAPATIAMGQGPGALLVTYAAWTRPDVFGGALALELPDPDAGSIAWARRAPAVRPRLWIEQAGSESLERPSATGWLDLLRAGADVEYFVGGARASRVRLVAAGLRGLVPE